MSDCMTLPKTVDEFMESYKVIDTEGIYMSKGAELVPIFRMKQWFEHLQEQKWIPCSERLPENENWQIITVCDESADNPYIYSDFGWYLKQANYWIVDAEKRRDIIAWMPLPKAYKGKR